MHDNENVGFGNFSGRSFPDALSLLSIKSGWKKCEHSCNRLGQWEYDVYCCCPTLIPSSLGYFTWWTGYTIEAESHLLCILPKGSHECSWCVPVGSRGTPWHPVASRDMIHPWTPGKSTIIHGIFLRGIYWFPAPKYASTHHTDEKGKKAVAGK